MKMKIDKIKQLFETEFKPLKDKFQIIQLLEGKREFDKETISEVTHYYKGVDIVWHPGCYVFFGNGKPYKVGRHLENSRKRVLEHIRDNTGGKISEISQFDDREILLFNVINRDDKHWVAAVEIFLETELRKYGLAIRSKRQG